MNKRSKDINPGGLTGTGQGLVNVNSTDYKALQKAIVEHAQNQSPQEKIKYELVSIRFRMENYILNEQPFQLIDAGEFLKEYLKAIGVKNKTFAKYIEIEESNLSSIIKGRRKINIDLAFKLGELFNMNPNLWLLIQNKNELHRIDHQRKKRYSTYRLNDLLVNES